jgi:outer membrane protein
VAQCQRLLDTETQNLKAAKMLLYAATQSYQITFGRYKAGVGSILELISTQVALSTARSQLTQAQLGHAQARLRLEVASGRVVLNK